MQRQLIGARVTKRSRQTLPEENGLDLAECAVQRSPTGRSAPMTSAVQESPHGRAQAPRNLSTRENGACTNPIFGNSSEPVSQQRQVLNFFLLLFLRQEEHTGLMVGIQRLRLFFPLMYHLRRIIGAPCKGETGLLGDEKHPLARLWQVRKIPARGDENVSFDLANVKGPIFVMISPRQNPHPDSWQSDPPNSDANTSAPAEHHKWFLLAGGYSHEVESIAREQQNCHLIQGRGDLLASSSDWVMSARLGPAAGIY